MVGGRAGLRGGLRLRSGRRLMVGPRIRLRLIVS